jgi:hypothetical protein
VNIGLIIQQMKTAPSTVALFNTNVAGAAEFQAAKNQGWLPLPAAYVIPGDMDNLKVENRSGYRQTVTETITVIVVFDNTPQAGGDRRGQAPVSTVDQAKRAICLAIQNWRPDSTVDNPSNDSVEQNYETYGFYFSGGRLGDMDLGRLFYEFDFSIDVLFGPEDCWQPAKAPLTNIAGTFGTGSGQVLTQTPIAQ